MASLIDLLRLDSRKWRYDLEVVLSEFFSSLAELRILIETHLEVVNQAAQEFDAPVEVGANDGHYIIGDTNREYV